MKLFENWRKNRKMIKIEIGTKAFHNDTVHAEVELSVSAAKKLIGDYIAEDFGKLLDKKYQEWKTKDRDEEESTES